LALVAQADPRVPQSCHHHQAESLCNPFYITSSKLIRQLLTKYGNDPNYRVKSKKSKFYDYSLEDLKKREKEIL